MKTGAWVVTLVAAVAVLGLMAMTAAEGLGAPVPLAHYAMEEGLPATTTADAQGGPAAVFQGPLVFDTWSSTFLAPVPTGTSQAIVLDKSQATNPGDWLDVPGFKGVTGTNPRSISAWINTTTPNANILSWGSNSGGQKWTFRVQDGNGPIDGNIRVEVNGGYQVGTTRVDDGRWHHVAAVWEDDGSPNVQDVQLYVDGQLEAISVSQSRSINTASGENVHIGDDWDNGRSYNGAMDDVRIYNVALTAADVAELAGPNAGLIVPVLRYDAGADDTPGNNTWEDVRKVYHAKLVGPDSDFDWDMSNVTHNPAPATSLPGIDGSYVFTAASTATFDRDLAASGNAQHNDFDDDFYGDLSNNSFTAEVWFRPSDLAGQEVLLDLGGDGDGSSLTLNDNMLQFVAKDDANTAGVTADLSGKNPYEFLQAVGVIDLEAGELSLYVDGELAGTMAYTGADWAGTNAEGLGSRTLEMGGHGGFFGDLSGYGAFEGEIALVNFYADAMTPAEVWDAYAKEAIPEPGTLALLGLGCAALGGYARRRRRGQDRNQARQEGTKMKDTKWFSMLVAVAGIVGLIGITAASAGLVNQWKLDEGSGIVAADSVGGQDGELRPTGSPPTWITTDLPPVPSGTTAAVLFDGSTHLINADPYKGIIGTNPRSVSAWIKTTEMDNEPVISWGTNTAGQKWVVRVQDDNGQNGAIRAEVSGGYIVGNLDVADGQWHHVAATWEDDGSPDVDDVKLYVNGARQATSATQGQSMDTASDQNVRIGRAVLSGRHFDGAMDEVRVYDHALTGREVRQLATGSTMPIASLNYDAALDTDGNSTWEDAVGLHATGAGLDYNLSGVTRNTSPTTSLPGITASYVFDGSATATSAGNIQGQFRGNPTDDDASFEVWFKPADLSGTEIVWDIGGSTDGSSFTLNDNVLQVVAKDGGQNGGATADLTGLEGDFIQAIATIDLKTDQLALFINGEEVAGSPVSLATPPDDFADWAGSNGEGLGSRGSSQTGGHGGLFGALNGYDNFVGDIASARMYTEVLSAADARELYNAVATEEIIPEPATLALLGLGCAALGGYARRRRRGQDRNQARQERTKMKDTKWFSMLVAVAGIVGLIGLTAANAGLVNQWKLDEGSGIVAADSVGGQDGELRPTGSPPTWITTDLPPVPSGTTAAVQFDGSTHLIDATPYTGITGTNPRSISAWIRTTSEDMEPIISWGNNSNGQKWVFRVQDGNGPIDGNIRVEVNGGYQIGSTVVSDGEWHHVAATWEDDGSPNVQDVRLWVDGELQGVSASQSNSINTASNEPVRIGRAVLSGRFFDGSIDEVGVYDHALARSEVLALAGQPQDRYANAVTADDPIAYWRLGEALGTKAFNEGSIGSPADADYRNSPTQGQPSLLPLGTPNPSTRFDGVDDFVHIPDNGQINTSGPWAQKSVELWFQADTAAGRQVIFEQGGKTRGLNLYIEDGELYFNAWNRAESNWGPVFVNTPVNADQAYQAVLVLDGDPDGDANTDDGTLLAYLNGGLVGTAAGAGLLRNAGDDAAIGAMDVNSWFHDDTDFTGAQGHFFAGLIDDVSLYNSALSAAQVEAHYRAAIPEPATLALLGLACAGLGGYVRRRRRAARQRV